MLCSGSMIRNSKQHWPTQREMARAASLAYDKVIDRIPQLTHLNDLSVGAACQVFPLQQLGGAHHHRGVSL